uniref:Tudor domain-containing protein n=1 Tax=Steinernema glaseri TaxID=37863 RepID=A0A1I8AUQ3_9BILA
MQRSLGEGVISKLLKRYAFIQEERLGKVYFPITSYLSNSTCSDLRDVFSEGDEIIFTAQRQSPPQADCRYVASSVVRKSELTCVIGKITEKGEKYAYAESRVGRVFVPYSARNIATNKPWLGRGIVEGARYDMRVMPQPEVSGCSYVAWSINVCGETFEEDFPLYRQNFMRMERQPDVIERQIGVVVSVDQQLNEASVYATQTGMSRINFLCHPSGIPIEQGVWLRYSVVKADHPSKCTWVAKDIEFLGYLMKLADKCLLPGVHTLSLHTRAVVCRVSEVHGAAWLWNDLLGRIYVSGEEYVHKMRCLSAVRLRVEYTGNFEDVPWSGYDLELMEGDTDTINNVAQLLQTDDSWKVTYVKEQESYYGFMENPKFGSAFIAWTDTTRGEDPPDKGATCRATVYKQYRDRKHQWRAVLVTPFDATGTPKFFHPSHRPSGRLRMPVKNFVPVGRVDPTKKPNLSNGVAERRPSSNGIQSAENGCGADATRRSFRQALVPDILDDSLFVPEYDIFEGFPDIDKSGIFGAIGSGNKLTSSTTPNSVPSNGETNGYANGNHFGDNGHSYFPFDCGSSTFETELDLRAQSPGSNNCSSPSFTFSEPFLLDGKATNGINGTYPLKSASVYDDLLNNIDSMNGSTWSFGGSGGLSLFPLPRKTSQNGFARPTGLPSFGSQLHTNGSTTTTTPSLSLESLVDTNSSPVANGPLSNGTNSECSNFADASTQTEILIEQEIIRKVTRCKKAISELAEECPEFFAMFVQVKWQ